MRIFIAVLLFFFSTSLAFSETLRRDVQANKTSSVYISATYNPSTCLHLALPEFKLSKPPKNGKVTFKRGQFKLSDRAGNCAGKKVKGTAIYYTPNKGFRGTDSFVAGFQMLAYQGNAIQKHISSKFIINVK